MISQGILLGLALSFMIGPLLFAIVEAGLERGFRAGLAVAVGIWLSDVLYVLAVWRGLGGLTAMTALPHFKQWAGLLGGCLLVGFGLGSFFKKTPPSTAFFAPKNDVRSAAGYALRGFFLNTVNPFTVFFWIGIAGGVVAPSGWGDADIFLFFGAMLLTLAVADTLKAYAAKRVRDWLTPQHIGWAKRGIGVLLAVFGVALAVRSYGL
jgi:threonine/homoserine/homoserine lactone efflux protein